MRNLHLYIGNNEVEFSTPPEILYTYQETDTTNPTVIKNSFSKTITIEGTPANNQLFGHFWSVQRLQNNSTEGEGVYFNASRKIPFQLFLDSELYESGYVKLDNVSTEGKKVIYSITLYGGLGDFFYSLNTTEDGDKKKLSDLEFDTDLTFTANIDTVKEAWEGLVGGDNEKWKTINFMTAYNGLPEDFDCGRVLINTNGLSLTKSKLQDGKTYRTTNGFVMADLPEEMTEWEIRDLRSYLQRPVISMKKIVEACCKQENNGGYEVILDEDFFNDKNPYWSKTWLTLPIISNLKYSSEEQTLKDSTLISLSPEGNNEKFEIPLTLDMGSFSSSIPSSISVRGKVKMEGYNNYKYTSWVHYTGKNSNKLWWGKSACYGSLFIQLIALNGDTVVGASEAYNLTSPVRHDGDLRYGSNSRYESSHQFNPYMGKTIYNLLGERANNYWCGEGSTTPTEVYFNIRNLNSPITNLKVVYFWGCSEDKRKKFGVNTLITSPYHNGMGGGDTQETIVKEKIDFEVTYSNIKGVLGEDLGRTGTEVDKETLLNTESTPCEYLLSYCKMFGLHFRKDLENNKIYIETRKTFYQRDNVVDLTPYLDKGSETSMSPLTFETKWYQFLQEGEESTFYKNYLSSRGIEYGSKLLNTGYEFIADKKNILEGNVIKTAIEGLEKSKYYVAYNNDNNLRSWFYGLKYNLYNGNDTIEVQASTASAGDLYGINDGDGMKYYDLIPKLQFHNNNDGTDGTDVLVFFSGFKNLEDRANPLSYYLSDDSTYQNALNEGMPCWLFTNNEFVNGKRIAYKLTDIPVFERYLTTPNSTTVEKSLDFGSPQELYVPNYSITDEVSIYDNFWKTYLEDLYDVNTRILTAYVHLEGKPNPEWLRRFYWFDNTIWRLNKIIDWNISSNDKTRCEFIKVEDRNNYTSITQNVNDIGDIWFGMPPNWRVPQIGGAIPIEIFTNLPNVEWFLINNNEGVTTSTSSGTGNRDILLDIEPNNGDKPKPIQISAVIEGGKTVNLVLYQSYDNETKFNVNPNNIVIGDNTLNIDFIWWNKGSDYVEDYRLEGLNNVSVVIDEIDDTAVISASNNTSIVESGNIVFISKEGKETAIGIDVPPKELVFDKDGGSRTLTFLHNTPTFEDIPFWITITKNGNKYTFTAKPNYYDSELSTYIWVNGVQISLKQRAGGIILPQTTEVTPNSLYFSAEGGTQLLNVAIPNTWIATPTENWFRLSNWSGEDKTIVTVTVGENTGNVRSGLIKILDDATGTEYSILVNQVGASAVKSFRVEPTNIDVGAEGGKYSITINYENRSGDYVSVTQTGGLILDTIKWQGDVGTLIVEIPENPIHSDRDFVITLTCQIAEENIIINQSSVNEELSVDRTEISTTYEVTTNLVKVLSNVGWKATTSSSWITASPSNSNAGYTNLNIIVEKNPSTTDRRGFVYLDSIESGNRLATITINQNKLTEILKVSPSSIKFSKDGGNASFIIKSNTDWEIYGSN